MFDFSGRLDESQRDLARRDVREHELSRRRLLLGALTGGVALAGGASAWAMQDEKKPDAAKPDASKPDAGAGKIDRSQFPIAPELVGRPWVNLPADMTAIPSIAKSKGKVIILTFWTFQCINCQRALPFWNRWAGEYPKSDVSILSVHTPELDAERDIDAVKKYSASKKLAFPVLVDNDLANWKAYKVRYWPSTYLIDRTGRVRGLWEGELDWKSSGEYKRAEQGVALLRGEKV